MSKLTVDYVPATDDVWEHFLLRQEGMRGLKIPGAYLPEFVEALEKPNNPDRFCCFYDYFVLNDKRGTTVSVYTREAPLLQLTPDHRAKLIALFRTTYASLISVYR